MAMENANAGGIPDHQFQRLLQIFPVVRTRDYCEDDTAGSSKAGGEPDVAGKFWIRLKSSVEPKLGQEAAARFCEAFRKVHKDVVQKKLPRESIEKITDSLKSRMNV